MKATIHEQGNGLPTVGDCVPGDDGALYRVTGVVGCIETGSAGCGNWMRATVDMAEWEDCEAEAEFPAIVSVGEDARREDEARRDRER